MLDIHEMNVLITDDAVPMCKSIHKMMKVIGYGGSFFFAHNGKEALDVLASEPIDLVMLDYNMPIMTGAEALAQIREDRSLGRRARDCWREQTRRNRHDHGDDENLSSLYAYDHANMLIHRRIAGNLVQPLC